MTGLVVTTPDVASGLGGVLIDDADHRSYPFTLRNCARNGTYLSLLVPGRQVFFDVVDGVVTLVSIYRYRDADVTDLLTAPTVAGQTTRRSRLRRLFRLG